ncbi:unnamed protein product [Phytophthora fragariaefolia]|uniref:Unnamed protein product n=1 Tax=Phytophthora fragariaefolia TaxID=1490495 RepID=A0A9W7DCM3_9STRA|nr:unnamed protein product [Phytophthora fragariaefolia]
MFATSTSATEVDSPVVSSRVAYLKLFHLESSSVPTRKADNGCVIHDRRVDFGRRAKWIKRKPAPAIKPHHKVARAAFAAKFLSKTRMWRRVIFSDKKKFNLDGPDGYQYYWHDVRTDTELCSKRVSGGGSVMVWAGMSANGKTDIAFLEGRQDSACYTQTLDNYLAPFTENLRENHDIRNHIFQQDNASIHESRITKAHIESMGIKKLMWPAKSPDLNPIENSALGSNLSILLLVCVGIYYWRTKQKENCIYDDIARQQAEAAAKLDALHGVGDGKVTELSMAMRRTSFKLNEADTSVITYACTKFLRRNAKSKTVNTIDINDPAQVAAAAASKATPTIEPLKSATKKVGKGKVKKAPIETIVEEAVDATL